MKNSTLFVLFLTIITYHAFGMYGLPESVVPKITFSFGDHKERVHQLMYNQVVQSDPCIEKTMFNLFPYNKNDAAQLRYIEMLPDQRWEEDESEYFAKDGRERAYVRYDIPVECQTNGALTASSAKSLENAFAYAHFVMSEDEEILFSFAYFFQATSLKSFAPFLNRADRHIKVVHNKELSFTLLYNQWQSCKKLLPLLPIAVNDVDVMINFFAEWNSPYIPIKGIGSLRDQVNLLTPILLKHVMVPLFLFGQSHPNVILPYIKSLLLTLCKVCLPLGAHKIYVLESEQDRIEIKNEDDDEIVDDKASSSNSENDSSSEMGFDLFGNNSELTESDSDSDSCASNAKCRYCGQKEEYGCECLDVEVSGMSQID